MTVAELIEKLQQMPQDAPVLTWDDGRDENVRWVVVEKNYSLTANGDPCHPKYPGARRTAVVFVC